MNSCALAASFLLAYVISWAAWAIPVLPSLGPMLAAIAVIALTTGRAGFRGLLSGLTRWRVGLRWWLVATSPVALFLLTLAALLLTGQSLPDSTDVLRQFGGSSGAAAFLFVLATVAASVGEEVGWRGYALPQLQTSISAAARDIGPEGLVVAMARGVLYHRQASPEPVPRPSRRSSGCRDHPDLALQPVPRKHLARRQFHAADNEVSVTGLTTTVVALAATLQGILLVVPELPAGRHGRSVLGRVANGPMEKALS